MNLCWAASAETLTNDAVEQCVSASDKLGPSSRACCVTPIPGVCDAAAWPRFKAHQFSYSVLNRSWPDFGVIEAEVKLKRGVAITQRYQCGGGTHMMSIIGVARSGSQELVEIYDPAGGFYTWNLYTTPLLDQAEYRESRSYFGVVPARPAVCTPKDGDPRGCEELEFEVEPKDEPVQLKRFAVVAAPDPAEDAANAKAAAQCAMGLVRALGEKDPESMNLATAAEASTAQLSDVEPIQPVYMPATGNCAQEGSNCPSCHLFFYQVGGKGRGAIVVGLHEGVWQAVKVGGDPTADVVMKLLRSQAKLTTLRKLLIVPELNLRFLQTEDKDDGPLEFVPLLKLPNVDAGRKFTTKSLKDYLLQENPTLKPRPLIVPPFPAPQTIDKKFP